MRVSLVSIQGGDGCLQRVFALRNCNVRRESLPADLLVGGREPLAVGHMQAALVAQFMDQLHAALAKGFAADQLGAPLIAQRTGYDLALSLIHI